MDKPTPCAPILLLGFNRPELLRGLVAILAKVRPPKIYLAVDGPRPDRPGEAEKCAACAAVAEAINWPCEVKKLVREKNLGCRLGVSGAIDWFFAQEEEGIILEDDCWPDPSFLRFATELLERYRDDPRIGIISGNNHYGFISDPKASYRFSYDVSIWGWATWRRTWSAAKGFETNLETHAEEILKRTKTTCRGRLLGKRFWNEYHAHQGTWDTPFALSVLGLECLNIVPRFNLVSNKGWGDGTHTVGFSFNQPNFEMSTGITFPLVHPERVVRDEEADRLHELRSFAWLPRILTVIGLKLGAVGRAIASSMHQVERFFPQLFRF